MSMQGKPGTSTDSFTRSKQKLSREASPISLDLQRPIVISEQMWIDVGVQKSFSTNDIATKTLESIQNKNETSNHSLSEFALNSILNQSARLSRSYSTWVSVGDHPSPHQLPSPHGQNTRQHMLSSQQRLSACNLVGALALPFTATDLIKSMNKKVRESYIRSRLQITHRAIERLSQSEFNLDQLATMATSSIPIAEGAGTTPVPELIVETATDDSHQKQTCYDNKYMNQNLTIHDIENERGKPLSKYDRNMLIFNWLHSLDESETTENIN